MTATPASSPQLRDTRRPAIFLALGALVALAAAIRLVIFAAQGAFAYDECFHAFVAEWIARHRAIPTEFPQLYGGFFYSYQPLLHLVGAAAFALAGRAALHALPVAFWIATAALLLWGARRAIPGEARAWAAALFVLNLALAETGVLFYVEGLTTLLFTAIAVAWVGWRRAPGMRAALVVGALLGLGLLTKFTAWMPVLGLSLVALALAARGRRDLAAQLGAALALAVVMALPWMVRNQLLFGSALYPAFAPDMDHAFYALNSRHYGMAMGALWSQVPGVAGYPLLAMTGVALIVALARRRWTIAMDLVGAALAGVIATGFTPMAAPRHLTPFLPMLALGASWIVAESLATRRTLVLAVSMALLAGAAGVGLLRGNPREDDEPEDWQREAYAAIAARVPPSGRVLSVWTYDTFYYSGRAATWPNPWGQRVRPLDEFYERDPARLVALFHRDSIDYVLAPLDARPEPFDSGNYPASLLGGLQTLMRAGAITPIWNSKSLVLLRLSPAAPAAPH